VRDTIARQLDVDKASVKMDMLPGQGKYRIGLITFQTREGKALDFTSLQADLKATRLGKGTRSEVKYLEITAQGNISVKGRETLLTVTGTGQQFALGDDPKAKKGAQTPFARLQAELAKGVKVTVVSGRIQGWSGVWPAVLRALSEQALDTKKPDEGGGKRPPLLIVTDFQAAKEKK
jgi:hypothetical protein